MSHNIDFSSAPVEQIEAEIGRRIESLRLAANISQTALAAEAGVSRRTITRLENGGGVALDTLIRVMRALGQAERFDAMLPTADVRPIDRVRLGSRQRQRASRPRTDETGHWTWAEDEDAGTQ